MNGEVSRPGDNENSGKGRPREITATEAFWTFFSSMKTAIVLLLVLAVTSITGTVIPQNEPAEFYLNRFGAQKYALLQKLSLTDVYHSTWFSVLLLLIGINLAVCSLNRFGLAWRRTFKPNLSATPESVKAMGRSEKLKCACGRDDAAARATDGLRSRGYCVSREQAGKTCSLYATKGRIAIWGPYLTHLSILVVFAGAVIGGSFGFNGFTALAEGKDASTCVLQDGRQTKDLGFLVRLHRFTIRYQTKPQEHGGFSRAVTGYKSDLEIIDNGKPVVRREIDVNHPLSYKGITFFQSTYGLESLILTVEGPNGETARESFRIVSQGQGGMPVYGVPMADDNPREIRMGGKTLGLFVHNLAPDYVGGERISASNLPVNLAAQVMINDNFAHRQGMQGWSKPDWVSKSKPVQHNGYTIRLEDYLKYSGLQVSQNPGLPVIYLGFALMILGVTVAFYVTHRTIRVLITESADGTEVIAGASSRTEMSTFDKDLNRLRDVLGE